MVFCACNSFSTAFFFFISASYHNPLFCWLLVGKYCDVDTFLRYACSIFFTGRTRSCNRWTCRRRTLVWILHATVELGA
ncbi:hypothetical protein L210DRAFT_3572071 [Boletus edulis BED1]|uniref:Uncharacterized protein n=1 Tax=Boletus edulis BED1 TaxID=1328754 RepID=A0AAD4BD77_BOLED|nr:hypothetical protein L210DRAFT_3572071 [Boletus edulis BED1]